MSLKDSWFLLESADSLAELAHRSTGEETRFYLAVTEGDLEAVRRNCEQGRFMETDGVGRLSRSPVMNIKYHFVITAALITRLCKEKGMDLELAFRLSDTYIQQLDDIHTVRGVQDLHDEMVMDYTRRMRSLHRSDTDSKQIHLCKEYIFTHIRERITVEDVAGTLGVSASYLSRLFREKTSSSVSAYIREQKVEAAKSMLRYTDHSLIDIASQLTFSSQSHFIQTFRKVTGVTPKKYRDQYYQVSSLTDFVSEERS